MSPTFRTRVLTLSAAALAAAASVGCLAATEPAAKPPSAVMAAPASATAHGAKLSAADRETLQVLTR